MKLFSKNPTHRANLSTAGFDCSFNCKFTSSVGQLIPVLYDFLLTGDKVKISEEMFTRTQPLSTAAFIDLREHIEYFFVPMNQIFSLWSSFRYSVGQPLSSMFDPSVTQKNLPGMDFSHIMTRILDVFTETLPEPPSYDLTYPYSVSFNSIGFHDFEKSRLSGARRLAHMLGFGYDGTDHDNLWQGNIPTGLKFSPFVACAYQKVFYDHFNIDQRNEKQRVCYNLDAWYSDNADQTVNPTAHRSDYLSCLPYWFELRYVPWKKDYFTGMYISPLESNVSKNTSFFGTNLNQITDYINSVSPVPSTSTGAVPSSTTGDDAASVSIDNRGTQNINWNGLSNRLNTQFIRKMFALEKFLSITRRSKDDYRSLTLSHFGTDMNPIYSDLSLQLGSTGQQIVVNDVAATVNNADTSLGELSGKASAFKPAGKDDTVQFTAPCEGVLLGIYYARPEVDYKQRGLDRLHTCLLPSDFYTAEYANLGYQPVFAHELDMSSADWQAVETNINRVIGWQYRYSQFKSKINKVYTGFTEPALSDWTISSNFDFSSFGSNSSDYYVNPSALDSIMIEKYLGGDTALTDWNFSFDPLLHWFHFNYYKVSVMDTYGLPNL